MCSCNAGIEYIAGNPHCGECYAPIDERMSADDDLEYEAQLVAADYAADLEYQEEYGEYA